MAYLAFVSFLWAFSFGLIGNALAGVDVFFSATVRLGLALLTLLPFLRFRRLGAMDKTLPLIFCGAVQFGLMYACYFKAFTYLPSHLVALFSITTPLYVVLIHDLRNRRFTPIYLAAALLSIGGAAVIESKNGFSNPRWPGILLMQAANLAFAAGQMYYRAWKQRHPDIKDHEIFAFPYLGGFLLLLLVSGLFTDWRSPAPTTGQWAVLLYLGVIASGLGFLLWNKGAARSRAGTLAAFNNAVVPLAVFCSLFLFGEIAELEPENLLRLCLGAILIGGAILLAEKGPRKTAGEAQPERLS